MLLKKSNYWIKHLILQNYKMNIQNNLISDIYNFCLVAYFKSNQSGFKTQKNHKSTRVFFKQNIGQNIENDAINNNNNIIYKIYNS